MRKFLFDTNALLRKPHFLDMADEIFIPYVVLEELDKIKIRNDDLGFRARYAVRLLKSKNNVAFDKDAISSIHNINDNVIIESAKRNQCILVTGDYLVQLKAESYGIEAFDLDESDNIDHDYSGIHELFIDPNQQDSYELLAQLYQGLPINNFNLVKNQYLVIWDKTKPTYDENNIHTGYEVIDKLKYNGERFVKLSYKPIYNAFTGKVKPLNVKQELMFDMLQDKSVTCKATFGSFGVGKDFVMISHAIDLIQKGKKLVWVRNNVEVKDSNPIGFLPSDMNSKLLPYAMPLADHLGGVEALEAYLASGKIEIQHLGFMRGRDIKDSIIYVTECENNTKEHIQLLLGRVSDGSQLWMNGDIRQIDHEKFTYNNGVNALKRLKGNKLYSQVTLDKVERSETAKLADLLD
ncbi:PhoH family protein [Brevibacillus gelatini]|nr:PhoH family protein [Brevibacillus gelatini]